jgi:hypothetical protein
MTVIEWVEFDNGAIHVLKLWHGDGIDDRTRPQIILIDTPTETPGNETIKFVQ